MPVIMMVLSALFEVFFLFTTLFLTLFCIRFSLQWEKKNALEALPIIPHIM